MGSIVTFYSYKGGVGRSMALANIAVLLAREKQRVLVIDWDLEAPGLERYFHYFPTDTPGIGILPLLTDARDDAFTSFGDYLVRIDVGSGRPIDFLSSGRERNPSGYADRLENFNWVKFFENGGGDFLENLRRQWKDDYNFVLIDSRTGLSDAGGVCTIQLPDIVVAMFSANNQSMLGARDVMRYVRRARQALAYPRMELTVLPLPTRFGSAAEFQESQRWIGRFASEFAEFYEDWLPAWAHPRDVLERIKVPQVDYFGFGEKLSVMEQDVADPAGMGYAYDQVARLLMNNFQDAPKMLGLRQPAVSRGVPEADPPAPGYEWDLYVSHPRTSSTDRRVEALVETLTAALTARLPREPRIFFDRQEVILGTHWPDQLAEALRTSRLMMPVLTPAYFSSPWNIAEWDTFQQREEVFRPSDPLIVPVRLTGFTHFPEFATSRQIADMSDVFPSVAPTSTSRPVLRERGRLLTKMAQIADIIAGRLAHVPPYQPDFPLVDPLSERL